MSIDTYLQYRATAVIYVLLRRLLGPMHRTEYNIKQRCCSMTKGMYKSLRVAFNLCLCGAATRRGAHSLYCTTELSADHCFYRTNSSVKAATKPAQTHLIRYTCSHQSHRRHLANINLISHCGLPNPPADNLGNNKFW